MAKMGRPSNYEIARTGELLNLCTDWLLKSWAYFDKETRLRISLIIVPKGLVDRHEVSGHIIHEYQEIGGMVDGWRGNRVIDAQIEPQTPQNTPLNGVDNPLNKA